MQSATESSGWLFTPTYRALAALGTGQTASVAGACENVCTRQPSRKGCVLCYLPVVVHRRTPDQGAPYVLDILSTREKPLRNHALQLPTKAVGTQSLHPTWRGKPVIGHLIPAAAPQTEEANCELEFLMCDRPTEGEVHYLPVRAARSLEAGVPLRGAWELLPPEARETRRSPTAGPSRVAFVRADTFVPDALSAPCR